jgi:hypothetical protein
MVKGRSKDMSLPIPGIYSI